MKSKTTPCVINENVEKILYLVLEKYKNYDGDELEKLTHSQTPWIIARGDLSAIEPCSTKILSKDIFTYFQANDMVVQ